MTLEELRNKIRERFVERGWGADKGTSSGVNDFNNRGMLKDAKERYKDFVVIHYPYFYNNHSNWMNKNNKFFDNKELLSMAWRNNPQKYDGFIIEIIHDILIEYLNINNLKFIEIIFQHYGTYEINISSWIKEERRYDVGKIGAYIKI